MIHKQLQRLAAWILWNGPNVGRLAPVLMDFYMGRKARKI